MDESTLLILLRFGRQVNRYRFAWACHFLMASRATTAAVRQALGQLTDALRTLVPLENRVTEERRLEALQSRLFNCMSEDFCCRDLNEFWQASAQQPDIDKKRLFDQIASFLSLITEWERELRGPMSTVEQSIVEFGAAIDQIVRPPTVSTTAEAVERAHSASAGVAGWNPPTEAEISEQSAETERRITHLLSRGVVSDIIPRQNDNNESLQAGDHLERIAAIDIPLLNDQPHAVAHAVAAAQRRYSDVSDCWPDGPLRDLAIDENSRRRPTVLPDALADRFLEAVQRCRGQPEREIHTGTGRMGIVMNEEAMSLRRTGYQTVIPFAQSPEAWPVLVLLFRAGAHGLSLEQRQEIDRHRSHAAWRTMKQRINDRLLPLNVQISGGENWTLEECAT